MYRTKLLVFYYIVENKQNTPMYVIIKSERRDIDTSQYSETEVIHWACMIESIEVFSLTK